MQREKMMKSFMAKGGEVEKVQPGVTAFKGKELKPKFKKDGDAEDMKEFKDKDAEVSPVVDHGAVVQSFLSDPEKQLVLRKCLKAKIMDPEPLYASNPPAKP